MNSRYGQELWVGLAGATFLLIFFCNPAEASPTFEDCTECHSSFTEGSYSSLHDAVDWGQDLMSGHEALVDNCDACHRSKRNDPVYLNYSVDSTLSKGCVGCHGRDEDVNGSCTGMVGEMGGLELECGSGAGLRAIHELNVEAGTCSSCHSGDPVPVGEQVAPAFYGQTGVVMQDACDGDGTESYFGTTGLDNDGDGQRDGIDSDCVSNAPPTQPGPLSADSMTVDSAIVSWGASTDPNDDAINYLVDYRHNGVELWTVGGSTTGTSLLLDGLDQDQSYDVRVTPNDGFEDGPDRIALDLFRTLVDDELIFKNGFETGD